MSSELTKASVCRREVNPVEGKTYVVADKSGGGHSSGTRLPPIGGGGGGGGFFPFIRFFITFGGGSGSRPRRDEGPKPPPEPPPQYTLTPDFSGVICGSPYSKRRDFEEAFLQAPERTAREVAVEWGLTTTSAEERRRSREAFIREAKTYVKQLEGGGANKSNGPEISLPLLAVLSALGLLGGAAPCLIASLLLSSSSLPEKNVVYQAPASPLPVVCQLSAAEQERLKIVIDHLTQPGLRNNEISAPMSMPPGAADSACIEELNKRANEFLRDFGRSGNWQVTVTREIDDKVLIIHTRVK